MTSNQQRAALQRQIWQIANDVRGSVDGWDFKQYVLGTLFYRFISENFASYIEAGDESINYAQMPDTIITPEIKDDAIKTKGYFIYPSQLFSNVAKSANSNESLNTDLAAIFGAIESSANGYPSEGDIKGLFADFDTTSNRLANIVKDKNMRLAAVLKGVAGLDFGDFHGSQIDLFGDAYEFLISNYAANAGKSGGEFFTPQHVSRLIAQLAMHKQTSVNKIYDPAAGSGSLLLQAKKHFDAHIIEEGFFGQEINHTTYNLARMNMFLHNINYDKFNMQLGNIMRVRRRVSQLERGIPTASKDRRIWYGKCFYRPDMVKKVSMVLMTYLNYVSPDGKKTPAEKLGLAKGSVRLRDILTEV